MARHVIQVPTTTIVMTGAEFMIYAKRYFEAAEALRRLPSRTSFDPIPYHLLCQSLELHLKSFIWLIDRLPRNNFKSQYGHDIVELWCDAKDRKIKKYCAPTARRDEVIKLVGPYYKNRQFAYLDLPMAFKGMRKLRENKLVIPTLYKLCKQLGKSLRRPMLAAN